MDSMTGWSGASPVLQGGVSPGLRGTRSGRASRRASREMPEVSARLFDINGPASFFTTSRTFNSHRSQDPLQVDEPYGPSLPAVPG